MDRGNVVPPQGCWVYSLWYGKYLGTLENLGVELLPQIKRSQLSWFRHFTRMPFGQLPIEMYEACPIAWRSQGRPRTPKGLNVTVSLGMSGTTFKTEAREVWDDLLNLFSLQPSSRKMDEWVNKFGFTVYSIFAPRLHLWYQQHFKKTMKSFPYQQNTHSCLNFILNSVLMCFFTINWCYTLLGVSLKPDLAMPYITHAN